MTLDQLGGPMALWFLPDQEGGKGMPLAKAFRRQRPDQGSCSQNRSPDPGKVEIF